MQIYQTLVLSTQHLTMAQIIRLGQTDSTTTYHNSEFTYRLYCAGTDNLIDEPELWEGMEHIYHLARSLMCRWIEFDECGSINPDLPIYPH